MRGAGRRAWPVYHPPYRGMVVPKGLIKRFWLLPHSTLSWRSQLTGGDWGTPRTARGCLVPRGLKFRSLGFALNTPTPPLYSCFIRVGHCTLRGGLVVWLSEGALIGPKHQKHACRGPWTRAGACDACASTGPSRCSRSQSEENRREHAKGGEEGVAVSGCGCPPPGELLHLPCILGTRPTRLMQDLHRQGSQQQLQQPPRR